MSLSASRFVGAVLMLAGTAAVLWAVFGVPQEWTGGMRWLRTALALAAFGAFGLAARFVFPDTSDGSADGTPSDALDDTPSDAPDGAPSKAPNGAPDGIPSDATGDGGGRRV